MTTKGTERSVPAALLRTRLLRLIGLEDGIWEIEIAAYLLTGQCEQFLEVQGRLLLGLLDIIERSGTAMMNRAIIMTRDPVRDAEQREHSHSNGSARREQGDATPSPKIRTAGSTV